MIPGGTHPSASRAILRTWRLACAALLTALLAGGSGFAATENPDGSETLWSATLTVKMGTAYGGDGYYSAPDPDEGALTSTSFTYNGNTFTFDFFGIESSSCHPGTPSTRNFVLFDTDTISDWENAETRWVLHVGSHTFDFADAGTLKGAEAVWCGVTDLGWSDSDMVEVKIVRRNEPGVPTDLTAAPSSAAQIDLAWNAPAKTGGSDITGYRIEVSTDGGINWSDLVADTESTAPEYEHTGLSAGDTRRYRVSAINAIGTGTASEAIEATTHAAPSAPRNLTAAAGNTKVTLNWRTPANGGRAITKYRVRRKAGNGSFGAWAEISGSDADTTSHEVTSLTNGTAYTFEVQAVNVIGNGAAASVAGTPNTGSAAWSFTVTAADTDANGDPVLTEGGAAITATATTNGVTFTAAQTVALKWGGADLDTGLVVGAGGATAITVDAGQSSGSLTISAPDTDTTPSYRPPKVQALTATHAGTRIGSLDLTLVDDEAPPMATITATPATVTEGGEVEIEVNLDLPSEAAITVKITVIDPDDAVSGTPRTSMSFAPGETTQTITLTAIDNLTEYDGERTVTVALTADASDHYTLGDPSSVTVTVRDNDTLPTAPRNLTATAISATRIDLEWDEPENAGSSTITGYRIEVSADDGTNWTELAADTASTDTEYSDTGTPPLCTALQYRVSAINVAGTGPASGTAEALARHGPPGAPVVPSGHPELWSAELVVGSGRDSGTDYVGYDPSHSLGSLSSTGFVFNGKDITISSLRTLSRTALKALSLRDLFKVKLDVAGSTNWTLHVGSESFAFSNADAHSQFEVEWENVDHNTIGWCDGDTVTVKLTTSAPGAPRNVMAAPGTGKAIDLSWNAPTLAGGSAITGYEYRQSADDGDNWGSWTATSSFTGHEVTGLDGGTTYLFQLRALNTSGSGLWSEPASGTTHAVPTAPRHLTAAAGNAKVTLNWRTPADGGSAITKYRVRRKAGNGSFGAWAEISGSDAGTTSHEVTSLTNGTAYTFEVQAVNVIGNGAAASVSGTPNTGSAAWSFTVTAADTDANGDPVLTEGGASITATATTNGVTFTAAQTVSLKWGGADLDTGLVVGAGGATAITVDAGQSSGSLTISAPDTDTTPSYRPPKVQALTATHAGTRIGSLDLTLVDDEAPPMATIAATPATVTEGGEVEIEVSLNLPSDAAITVKIAVTDTADAVSGPPRTSMSFAPGETTQTITLTAIDNLTEYDGERTVTVALAADASDHYTLGDPSSVTVTVRDNDTEPTAPRNLTARAISATRIDLDWDEPENAGRSTVIGYRIEVSADDGTNWTELVADTDSTDTEYSDTATPPLCAALLYRVSAINVAGTGPASDTAEALARHGPPGAPVVPSGHPELWSAELVAGSYYEDDRTYHIGYDPPNSLGSLSSTGFTFNGESIAIWSLTTLARPVGDKLLSLLDLVKPNLLDVAGSTNWTLHVGSTSFAFSNADEHSGTQVKWRNVDHNTIGWCDGDTVTVKLTTSAPGAPLNVTATPGTGKTVDLSWNAPTHAGGSAITGYEYRRSADGGDNRGSWTATSSLTGHEVTGLDGDTTYLFQLRALNTSGSGLWSEAVEATTHAAPSAPANLTAAAGNAKVELNWTTPANGGSAITKYRIRRKAGSGSFGAWADISGSDADTTGDEVTGLANGTAYTFEVRAVNAIGEGAAASVVGTPEVGSAAWSFTVTAADTDGNGDPVLTEGGASITATATITNGVTFTSAETVALEWGGADLTTGLVVGAGGATAITIDAGQSGGNLTISAPDTDTTPSYRPPDVQALTATHAGTRIGSVNLTLVDDEAPPVATIAATPATVTEGGAIAVEVTLDLPFGGGSRTVRIAVTDADGALSGTPPTGTSFATGQTTRTIPLTADDNSTRNDDGRTVTVALAADATDHYTPGTPSSVTVTVRDNDTPPTAPRNLATAAGDGEAMLAWQAPESDNGSPIAGYEYRRSADGGDNWNPDWTDIPDSDADTASYYVRGLTNDTQYTFEVRAVNGAGGGPGSNQVRATPGEGVPLLLRTLLLQEPAITVGFDKDFAQYAEGRGARAVLQARTAGSVQPTQDFSVTVVSEGEDELTEPGGPTAVAGKDFTAVSATYTFRASDFVLENGQYVNSVLVEYEILADDLIEKIENFFLLVQSAGLPPHVTVDSTLDERLVIINDDSGVVNVTATGPREVTEGEEFDVILSVDKEIAFPWTVVFAIAEGTALENLDYVHYVNVLEFQGGERRKPVRVRTLEDNLIEGDEQFVIRVVRNGLDRTVVLPENDKIVTIKDNDAPSWSVTVTPAELSSTPLPEAGGSWTMTVSAGGVAWPENQAIAFDFADPPAAGDGYTDTATPGEDFRITDDSGVQQREPNTLILKAGSTEVTGTFTIVSDTRNELTEAVLITPRPGGVPLGGPHTFTIIDDDGSDIPSAPRSPRVSSGDGKVIVQWTPPREPGNTLSLSYEYRLEAESSGNSWIEIPDSGPGGANHGRYAIARPNGSYTVVYLRAKNAFGTGPDVHRWGMAHAGAPGAPGNFSAKFLSESEFRLSWTEPAARRGATIVSYIIDRSPDGLKDWGTYDVVVPGTTSTTGRFSPMARYFRIQTQFRIDRPTMMAGTEFDLAMSETSPAVRAGTREAFVDPSLPQIRVWDAHAREDRDAAVDFTVRLHPAAASTVTVSYRTRDVGATAPVDYGARSGRLTFAPGQTEKTVSVPIVDDTVDEHVESFALLLSNVSGARLGNEGAAGMIHGSEARLSVADARTQEAPGATLAFAVTLSRAVTGAVTVDYATSDGTATAGADYTQASGTLTFAPGETQKTVTVAVLDDVHDDGGETLTLTLSNPTGAVLGDARASGVIENTDPLQRAWLARFGRAAAEHVMEAVGARIEGRSSGPARLTLGGRQVLQDASWPAEGAIPTSWTKEGDFGGLLADRRSSLRREGADARGRTLSTRELLLASSFHLASADAEEEGPRWSFWGRGARSRLSGKDGALALDGDVSTGMVGADYESGRMLLGLALAYSAGEGSYGSAEAQGELESTLASAHPYLRYAVSDGLSLWGVLGLGVGELTVDPEGAGEPMATDLSMGMAALGARGALPSGAGFDLAWKSDASLVRSESDAVEGLAAAEAETTRLRLALEGSRDVKLGDGVLRPSLEAGLRHDGGDAETGSGIELGGALRYSGSGRLTMEVRARGLLAHEQRDYEDWGVSASAGLAPGAGGRGLSIKLGSSWGAAAGGADRLWSQRTAAALVRNEDFEPGAASFDAEVGYGLAAMGALLTPHTGVAVSGSGQTYRVGGRFKLGEGMTMSLEGNRREKANDERPDHGMVLRVTMRW